MYNPGVAGRGRGTSKAGGTPSPNLQSHHPTPGGQVFLLGHKDPAQPHCSTPCPSHILHLLSAHLGKAWRSPEGRGAVNPIPGLPKLATCSPPPSGPPLPGPLQVPKPGLWGWPEHSARLFSDLTTYRYLSPSTRGSRGSIHIWVPLVPQPTTRATQISSSETQTNPILCRPGKACSPDPEAPALRPCRPLSPALGWPAGPQEASTLWRHTCFYLLRDGTTWCMEGEGTPAHPTPVLTAIMGPGLWGGGRCILGWRLLWQQRVKANPPGFALSLAWPEEPPVPRQVGSP